MGEITKNEEILLIVIWRLEDIAYGVQIKKLIFDITGKNWNYGTLYCTLDQLVKKGLAQKKTGEPLPERGGRRKIFYKLTSEGVLQLKSVFQIQQALWEGISDLKFSKG
jgi:DNA-binding PadR family transcriptional regulator